MTEKLSQEEKMKQAEHFKTVLEKGAWDRAKIKLDDSGDYVLYLGDDFFFDLGNFNRIDENERTFSIKHNLYVLSIWKNRQIVHMTNLFNKLEE